MLDNEHDLKRREHNKRVLERMANPADNLCVIDVSSTWFPPRPVTVKDKDAIKKLYNLKDVDGDKDDERISK